MSDVRARRREGDRERRRAFEAAWEDREARMRLLAEAVAGGTSDREAELAELKREHATARARLIERLGYPKGLEPHTDTPA